MKNKGLTVPDNYFNTVATLLWYWVCSMTVPEVTSPSVTSTVTCPHFTSTPPPPTSTPPTHSLPSICLRPPAWLPGSSGPSCLFLGTDIGWHAMAREREDEGANAPSPCPHFWGHKWSPAPPLPWSPSTSSSCPFSLLRFPFLPELVPSEQGWSANCCRARRAKPVGGRDIVLESTSPLVPTAVGQRGICNVMEISVGVTEMPSVKEKGIVSVAFPPALLQLSVRNTSDTEMSCSFNPELHKCFLLFCISERDGGICSVCICSPCGKKCAPLMPKLRLNLLQKNSSLVTQLPFEMF